jgi:peptidyl-prolyl cis-trans isomerase D
MLQQIRDKSAGIVVRVLFLVLVASFAMWGIGDPRWLSRSDPAPVRVAGEDLPIEQLRQEYQRDLERMRRAFGADIDPALARQLGLPTQTIDKLVARAVLERAALGLGLNVDDQAVRERIAREPAFQVGGAFDRAAFQRALYEQQLTEPRFVQMVRSELARGAIVDGVTLGAGAPPALTDVLFRHREERRSGTEVLVGAASVPEPAAPQEAELRAVYDRDLARFTEPELRALTVVRVGREEMLAAIRPDEERLRADYAERLREFSVPERRTLELIRFPDAAAAEAAKAKLDAGAEFLAVAREAGQDPDAVRFGTVARADLPRDLGDPVFALAKDAVSAPIATALGTYLARVTAIEPGRQPSFEELRDRLARESAERLAGEAAYRAALRLEELVNQGQPLAEAAKEIGVPAVEVAAVDGRGNDRDGKPVAVLAGVPEALAAAFAVPAGRDTGLVETRAGAFVVARVDSVTPPQPKPFDAVRAEILAQAIADARAAAARARAEEIVRKVEGGATLEAAAEAFGLKAEPIPETRRDGRTATEAVRVPAAVAQALFALKPGGLALAPSGAGGTAVVRLDATVAADPAQLADAVKQLSDQLANQIAGEMANEYVQALRRRYGVTVDPGAAERLVAN